MPTLVNNSKIASKGERLNWTPIEKVKKVTLKMMNIKGKPVSNYSCTNQKSEQPSGKSSNFLIP